MSAWIQRQNTGARAGDLGPLQLAWLGDAVWELHNACVSAGHPVALMFFTVLLLPGSVPRLRLMPLVSLIPC